MSTTALSAGIPAHAARASSTRRFYVSLALLMTAMVVVGFWPTYFGPLLGGTYSGSWLFHLHGTVFLGWMLLFVAQAALVSTGRTRVHRRIGTVGIAYGLLVLIVGLTVTIYAPLAHIASGAWDLDAAAAFLLLPLGDMALFAGLFAAAIAYRRQPEVHKRLMLLATIAIVFAAVSRRIPYESPATFLLAWLTPLAAAMAYDWRTRGHVHRTYAIGMAVFVVAFTRVFVMNSEPWLTVGRTVLAPFL
ncbi:MAG: hypothetical protein HYU37_16735 [Acidobacteria bacterium]|nr:hypothetical protein [Acidobacteriota bacterium]